MNPLEAWLMLKGLWIDAVQLLTLWPWFLGVLLAGYLLGAWLGWRGAAVIAAILGLVAFLRSRAKDTTIDYEDGEPGEKPVKRYRVPPRRKPSFHESLTK